MKLRYKLLAAFAVVVMVGAVVVLINDPRGIVPVDSQDFPWEVYVTADSECGGVIVKQNWVLTAAHCVWKTQHEKLPSYIYAGGKKVDPRHYIRTEGKDIVIHKCYVKLPDENALADYDIALIPLTLPLGPSYPNRAAIARASESDEPVPVGSERKSAFVAGWVCGSPIRKLLRACKLTNNCGGAMVYTDVAVKSQDDCDKDFPPTGGVGKSRYFCAGNYLANEGGFNKHDSGTGLTTSKLDDAKLIGIANQNRSKSDVYARVSQYDDWIRAVIGDGNPKGADPVCP